MTNPMTQEAGEKIREALDVLERAYGWPDADSEGAVLWDARSDLNSLLAENEGSRSETVEALGWAERFMVERDTLQSTIDKVRGLVGRYRDAHEVPGATLYHQFAAELEQLLTPDPPKCPMCGKTKDVLNLGMSENLCVKLCPDPFHVEPPIEEETE